MFEIESKRLTDAIDFLSKTVTKDGPIVIRATKDGLVTVYVGDATKAGYYQVVAANVKKPIEMRVDRAAFTSALRARKNLVIAKEGGFCTFTAGSYEGKLSESDNSQRLEIDYTPSKKGAVHKLHGDQKKRLTETLDALHLTNPFQTNAAVIIFLESAKGKLKGGCTTKWHGVWRETKSVFDDFTLGFPTDYLSIISTVLEQPEDINLRVNKSGFELSSEHFWIRMPAIEGTSDHASLQGLVENTRGKPEYETTLLYEDLNKILDNMGAVYDEGSTLELKSKKGHLICRMKTQHGEIKDSIRCDVKDGLKLDLELKTLYDVLGKLNGDFLLKSYGNVIKLEKVDEKSNTSYFLAAVS